MSYPEQLAHGLTLQDAFVPFELFAGDLPVTSDTAQAAGVDLEQFRVVARDEAGNLVPWSPTAGEATGTLTVSGVGTAADTATIDGQALTLVAGAPAAHQAQIGGTSAATAANIVAAINAAPDDYHVSASIVGLVITLTALEGGVGGNAITLAKSSTALAVSGATLTGGSDQTDNDAIGITAVAIPAGSTGPYYRGGFFNDQALVWPASVSTLVARKMAFDGTPIGIGRLK